MSANPANNDSENTPSATGCCKIKVYGRTKTYNGVTKKGCNDTAANLGGTVVSFEEGVSC